MNYLSYGGGVNSTAMLLLLLDEGWEFEVVYVDHGCDWPETRNYVYWLSKQTPITVIKPDVQGYDNLYDHCLVKGIIPSRMLRWCTDKFKVTPLHSYFQGPAFNLIGISTEESHRVKLDVRKGIESRFPLIEYEIDREECKKIILDHGLPLPIKSGCWFCPYQPVGEWRRLRRVHPDLFCKAVRLENQAIEARAERGKAPLYLSNRPLGMLVHENQDELFAEFAPPPCNCML